MLWVTNTRIVIVLVMFACWLLEKASMSFAGDVVVGRVGG